MMRRLRRTWGEALCSFNPGTTPESVLEMTPLNTRYINRANSTARMIPAATESADTSTILRVSFWP